MGDKINVLIDDLQAFLLRILGLPLSFQLLIWVCGVSLVWLIFLKLLGFTKLKDFSKSVKLVFYCTSVFLVVFAVLATAYDSKKYQMEQELLRSKKKVILTTELNKDSTDASYFSKYLENLKKLSFGTVTDLQYLQNDPGMEIMEINLEDPKIVAFIAAIDLSKYNVVLDTGINKKELTSSFCKRFDADFAVNGEAGMSPGEKAPLGHWTGNYVVNGKPYLLTDTKSRPFLYFDKENNVYYSPDAEVVTNMNDKMYNVIWGRFDLILEGKIAIDPADATKKNPYPRTIVGIDKSGKYAFFMVVDGRRPEYSKGMTMQMCGEVMMAMGCYNAMACDQGGSSMMYSKKLDVVNRPADGRERVVYTHLGFRKK
ncbi:MAG: phosphodiester glycosidase family protein [Bacteroidota bacterium]|jgi:exopolysaccharide biosynthesis protein